MSKGLAGVKTLTAKQIADKWKLPLAVIAKKIAAGVKVEKEHTTSLRQASEIARDHLGERPDYYEKIHKMEKTKIVKEDNATGAVRGLGFVTGDPGVNYVDQYINTNAMSYTDLNGNILKMIKDKHDKHLKNIGFNSYSPNDIQNNSNKVIKEAKLNELGEYDNKGGTPGYEGTSEPIRAVRKRDVGKDVVEQSPANVSYKERPLYERGKVPADMSGGSDRGIYQEASAEKLSAYTTSAAERLASGSDAGDRQKEVNRITGINTAVRKLHPEIYPGEVKVPVNELSNETLGSYVTGAQKQIDKTTSRMNRDPGSISPADDRLIQQRTSGIGLATSKMGLNEISAELVGKVSNARFWRGEAPSKTLTRAINKKFIESGTKKKPKKETKMDTKEHINEALDCILEDNLTEMKDNLMIALQEKAIEKLEERKKEIAANYFAQ